MCLYCIIYKYIIQYIGCYIKHYLQKIPRNQWFPSMFCSLQNSVLRNNYRELQFIKILYDISAAPVQVVIFTGEKSPCGV